MTSIVYPYVQEKAQGEELKYSIRSFCKYADFEFNIVIVGDKPNWYQGDHIPVKRTRGMKFRRAIDIANKLQAIIEHPKVTDEFIYCYDDQYLVNKLKLEDISGAIGMKEISSRTIPKVGSETWIELMRATVYELGENGADKIYNYETHLPRVLDKKKLQLIIDAYDLHNTPLLFNTLYFNEFYHNPKHLLEVHNPIKAGIYKPMNLDNIKAICRDKLILNHGERAWNHQMNIFLKNSYHEKCKYEI